MPVREPRVPGGVDVTIPSVARIYDYMLGGKDHFAVDREAAGTILRLIPDAQKMARDNRDFMIRSVRFLAQAGVEQFIDLGTGIPTSPNVHEVARKAVPGARVVYVDHDPVVLAHSRALLATDDGVIAVGADLREPAEVLGDPAVARLIDFSQPVALLILSVLHFVGEEEEPDQIVAGYRDRLAPASYLVVTAGSSEGVAEDTARAAADLYRSAGTPVTARSRERIMEFFAGCDLADPGLVSAEQWRPDADTDTAPTAIHVLAGVGRKR